MWRRGPSVLLQRGQRLPRTAENLGQRLRAAKTAEYKQVQKVRKAKQETNAYHKAQYISAFVEAHSAEMTHAAYVKKNLDPLAEASACAPAQLAASSPNMAVTALSRSLESANHTRRVAGSRAAASGDIGLRSLTTSQPRAADDVSFGAWRAIPAPLAKQAASAEFLTHCVLREATTPAAWCPHAVHRVLSASPVARAAADFGAHVAQFAPRHHVAGNNRGKTVDADKLYKSFRACRRTVQDALRHGDAGTAEATVHTFDSFVVQQLVHHLDWSVALAVLSRHLGACRDSSRDRRSVAPAQLVAIYAESVRQHFVPSLGSSPGPTLDAIHALLQDACDATAHDKRSSVLDTVVAAPVLSLLHAPQATVEDVEALARRYLIQAPPPISRGRQYLPAIGWGAYLAALHRCGANLSVVQAATDEITDGARTKRSNTLLQSPHLWRAYIESCAVHHVQHAWDIFNENASHYHVPRTPSLAAAMMHTLLSSADSHDWDKAESIWKATLSQSAKMITPTAGVVTALLRLHEKRQNADALTALCTDFSGVYAYYGVGAEEWDRVGGVALHKNRVQAFERHGPSPFIALLHKLNQASPLQDAVPAAVVAQVQRSLKRLSQQPHSRSATTESVPEMTAEMLAEML